MYKNILRLFFISAFFVSSFFCQGQNKSTFFDGRNGTYCSSCQILIEKMPKEVLFGIQINSDGEVYFAMNDKNWFDKIFKNNSYGVSVDLISKERYNCSKQTSVKAGIPKGLMLQAKYKNALLESSSELYNNGIFTKIGNIPLSLVGKEIEGNLVILYTNKICYYTNFVDIERDMWQLLPMGFFTDTLLNEYINVEVDKDDFFLYSSKIDIEIPFTKGSSTFDFSYLKKYYNSINLSSSSIKKVEIRAYSSIEGPETVNKELMSKRAESMIVALKKYQLSIERINVITAENWLDFFKDIKGTKFENLSPLSKLEIKQKLTDAKLLSEAEPILARHRKVVAILYLENKTHFSTESDSSILKQFNKAIAAKEISNSQNILKEIANRIIDKKLPIEFIRRIEVPNSKEYSPLLNDREIYKYILKETYEYEALENLLEIRKLDSINGKLNYNICVMRFFLWQFSDDSLSKVLLPGEIENLNKQGISDILSKRMEINYYILKSEDQMRAFDYEGKDSSLNKIRIIYRHISSTDEDTYSLAKYYSFYSHFEWAQEIIEPIVGNVNINEDLLFYYLNLLFFQPDTYFTDKFKKATLNAINLNTKRFCNFFNPCDKGGASMQLLEYEEINELYCSECNPIPGR
ncbi:MAG: hypothetical protein ACHQNT_08265 [Bacteroidia bacterium]